jgi:hypothetical protein
MWSKVGLATDERGKATIRHDKGDPDLDVEGGLDVEASAAAWLQECW